MRDIMNEFWYLIIAAISSILALFIIAKLLGKKQIAQLNFVDYIVGISIGSIAAEMATDINDKPMYYYLIALLIYFLFDFIVTIIERKSPCLKHFFKGGPLTVIYDGEVDYKVLKRSKLDINDLLTLARTQGYFDLSDIAYAIFENDGKLSILPKSSKRPTVAEDLNIEEKPASLPIYLIIDGLISWSSLREIKKDKSWLFSKLGVEKKSQLKSIILAIYDEEKDSIITTYK